MGSTVGSPPDDEPEAERLAASLSRARTRDDVERILSDEFGGDQALVSGISDLWDRFRQGRDGPPPH